MSFWDLMQTALPWLWVGMVLGISFLEAPLKFRAPGITLALGVGIGRLVFRALNAVELVLAIGLVVAVTAGDARSTAVWVLLGAALAALVLKAAIVRPLMDRRALRLLAGEPLAPSGQHVIYVGLEVVTVLALGALGVVSLDLVTS